MKSIVLFLFISLTSLSCRKGYELLLVKQLNPDGTEATPIIKYEQWNNWCIDKGKIAFWGDSFTEASGIWPLSYEFSLKYFNDSIVIGTYPDGHIDNWGSPYGGYLRDNSSWNGGVSRQNSVQILQRFLADKVRNQWTAVIWIGRNNSWDTATIRANIDTIIARLPHRRYIVLPILTGDWENEYRGTDYWKNVTQFNASSAALYKDHFVDAHAALQAAASNTPGDMADIQHDVTPRSLRFDLYGLPADELHLNRKGEQVVADAIIKALQKCNTVE